MHDNYNRNFYIHDAEELKEYKSNIVTIFNVKSEN